MTPAPTSIKFFQAKPERGATRPYVPSGNAIAKSVFAIPLPDNNNQQQQQDKIEKTNERK